MLCDISQVGVRYDSDPLYALVMISNEAKLILRIRARLIPDKGLSASAGMPAMRCR
jgi:hypothetical protein